MFCALVLISRDDFVFVMILYLIAHRIKEYLEYLRMSYIVVSIFNFLEREHRDERHFEKWLVTY